MPNIKEMFEMRRRNSSEEGSEETQDQVIRRNSLGLREYRRAARRRETEGVAFEYEVQEQTLTRFTKRATVRGCCPADEQSPQSRICLELPAPES